MLGMFVTVGYNRTNILCVCVYVCCGEVAVGVGDPKGISQTGKFSGVDILAAF